MEALVCFFESCRQSIHDTVSSHRWSYAGTAYLCRSAEFIPGFQWGSCFSSFSFFVQCFVYHCLNPSEYPFGIFNLFLSRKYIGICNFITGYGLWSLMPLSTIYQLHCISRRSVLLVEETGVPRENHRLAASHIFKCCITYTSP